MGQRQSRSGPSSSQSTRSPPSSRAASPKRRRLSPSDIDLDLTGTDEPSAAATPPKPHADKDDTKQTKLAPLFRPPAPSHGSWLAHLGSGKGCGHFVSRSPAPSTKVAAFGASILSLHCACAELMPSHASLARADIDGTLIQPLGDRKYPKNDTDWQWINPRVVPKLRELHATGCVPSSLPLPVELDSS